MKRIDAKDVIKVMNWISQTDDNDQSILEPIKNSEGTFECIIYLPVVDKAVVGLGDSKIESIDNATKQSSLLIDEYLEKNPCFAVKNLENDANYVLEENDNHYLNMRLSKRSNC